MFSNTIFVYLFICLIAFANYNAAEKCKLMGIGFEVPFTECKSDCGNGLVADFGSCTDSSLNCCMMLPSKLPAAEKLPSAGKLPGVEKLPGNEKLPGFEKLPGVEKLPGAEKLSWSAVKLPKDVRLADAGPFPIPMSEAHNFPGTHEFPGDYVPDVDY